MLLLVVSAVDSRYLSVRIIPIYLKIEDRMSCATNLNNECKNIDAYKKGYWDVGIPTWI